jgi:hypothetical protein
MSFVAFNPDPENPGTGVAFDEKGREFPTDLMTTPGIEKLPTKVQWMTGADLPPPPVTGEQPSAMSPRAAAVLAKRDAVLGPLVPMGSSTTTNVQKGLSAAQLDPILAEGTKAADEQASLVEETGRKQTERAEQSAISKTGAAYGQYVTSEQERADAAQIKKIADLNRLAIASQQDPEIDPDQFVRNMPAGKSLAMIVLATLNGAFKGLVGQQGNDVLDIIDTRIKQSIDAQKEQIQSGRIRRGNMIQFFSDQGMSAEQAERAARAMSYTHLDRMQQAEAERIGAPAALENAKLLSAGIKAKAAEENRQLKLSLGTDKVTTSTTTQMGRPAATGGMSPSDFLSMMKIRDAELDAASAEEVAKAIGRPISSDEAKKIKSDAQDYAVRIANNMTTKQTIQALAKAMNLQRGANGWEGDADPGLRPLGQTALSPHARRIDRLWSQLKEAKIMNMSREPANTLQKEFGEAVNRPFWDADITTLLNDIEARADAANASLDAGFKDAAVFYKSDTDAPNSGYVPGKAKPH